MHITKQSFLKLATSFFLLNSFFCAAMNHKIPKNFKFQPKPNLDDLKNEKKKKFQIPTTFEKNKEFDSESYEQLINEGMKKEKDIFDAAKKRKAEAEEAERKKYLEELAARASHQTCQYGSGSIGPKADEEMGNYFKAQADHCKIQSNSLNNNNYYTVMKDGLGIVAQLVAPAVSQSITPVLVEARQKLYKTHAEKKAEEDAERQTKALESLNRSQIKEKEAEELAQIGIGLNHVCGQSIPLSVKGQQNCQDIFEAYLERVKAATDDLKKRQESTGNNTNKSGIRSKL